MNFFQWTTDYQLYCRSTPKRERMEYSKFLRWRRRQQQAAGIPIHRLLTEGVWTDDGSPYYNVHPNLVSKLCKVDMDKIPSTLFKMPHGVRAVNIRFAQKHDEFTVNEPQHTDVVARLSNTSGTAPSGSFVHSILMIDMRKNEEYQKGQLSILFIMDFDVFTPLGQPVYSMFGIAPDDGISLQTAINQAKGRYRSPSYINMMENVIKCCVSIGFLADNPTICEPDILASDRSEYARANDERREFLFARAKRKGKNGYNVGTDIMFLGERPLIAGERRENPTGRELEYAHIRGGHPHLVRYGEGKKLVKVMWYVPTTVRPDKPFKAED